MQLEFTYTIHLLGFCRLLVFFHYGHDRAPFFYQRILYLWGLRLSNFSSQWWPPLRLPINLRGYTRYLLLSIFRGYNPPVTDRVPQHCNGNATPGLGRHAPVRYTVCACVCLSTLDSIDYPEPVFVNLLRSPGIDYQHGGPVQQPYLLYLPAMQAT